MPRTLCACSMDRCGRFTAFWRPLLGSGRIGKHRRAPQEDASAALALDPRSCSSRPSATPAVSWQHWLDCGDIGARIATMETRTEELEIEVKAATAQTTTQGQGQQISDIQWKLEDAENRQRRNNLRILRGRILGPT
ncbi:hypothetical protein NDU88_000039 [Pleurodeles waltl]|uniref:Uncharacterized protein n=1 Tax=Pleurodeles waltl TaxID=8319 RepID=A0AAV7V6M6_PLEWA|nr:hypothetical protein NDU88_000039 [Pleurodeles waltl]